MQPTDRIDQGSADAFAGIVGGDEGMRRLFGYLASAARTAEPVLITGETGSGKNLAARALHALGGRPGELVEIAAGTLGEDAFAGESGPLARAAGGTLVLDEIGELPIAAQAHLVRWLQQAELAPTRRAQPRLVAITSRDPRLLHDSGAMRPDLYFRLRTHHAHVPALRERRLDLPLLLDHFAVQAATELDRPRPAVPPDLTQLLAAYRFPGNVRELRALVFDGVSRGTDGVLQVDGFRSAVAAQTPVRASAGSVAFPEVLPTLKQVQDLLVAEALSRTRGNQSQAAGFLGITRQGLNKRLRSARRAQPQAG